MRITFLLKSSVRHLNVVGLSNGHAGRHLGCEHGLSVIQQSKLLEHCRVPLEWHATIQEAVTGRQYEQLPGVIQNSQNLSVAVSNVLKQTHEQPNDLLVFGGDHSCGIGTWSGVASSMRHLGDIGLIWVDAHMDAHTIESSPTGNIHGTPVAHLLGFGNKSLCSIGDPYPKIKPQNLCLVGIRSFEDEERELLTRLGVRIFYDSEVQQRGIAECMLEAVSLVSRNTHGYGMSIDLDAFRIKDAPAVGTPEIGGIRAADFVEFLRDYPNTGNLIATELVEFMPHKDCVWKKSERLLFDLIESIYLPKIHSQEFEEIEGKRQHGGRN